MSNDRIAKGARVRIPKGTQFWARDTSDSPWVPTEYEALASEIGVVEGCVSASKDGRAALAKVALMGPGMGDTEVVSQTSLEVLPSKAQEEALRALAAGGPLPRGLKTGATIVGSLAAKALVARGWASVVGDDARIAITDAGRQQLARL